MLRGSPQLHLDFAIATKGGVPVRPRTWERRRIMLTAEPLLGIGALPIIGGQQVGKVCIVDVAPVKVFRGRSLERIGRSLTDEGSQELALVIGQQHG
jgi:hypothetical protein